jgi:hypothetical protein
MTRLVLALVLAATFCTQTVAAELTSRDVRVLLASIGINPGTSRQVGTFGLQTLTYVNVRPGRKRGDFVVRLHIRGK